MSTQKEGGAICGGVMSESQMMEGIEKHGAYFGMMSFVLPDKHYNRYIKLANGNLKEQAEAKKIFKKYARSQI